MLVVSDLIEFIQIHNYGNRLHMRAETWHSFGTGQQLHKNTTACAEYLQARMKLRAMAMDTCLVLLCMVAPFLISCNMRKDGSDIIPVTCGARKIPTLHQRARKPPNGDMTFTRNSTSPLKLRYCSDDYIALS